jgi:serine/threonine-protein kinase
VKKGEYHKGILLLQTAVSLSAGDTTWLAQLGQVYGIAGQTERAREILRQLEEEAARRYVSPYHLAYVHTGLGEPELAIDCLEQAYERRSGAVYGIRSSFLFTALHSHPRFTALLRKMNLA